MDSGTLGPVAHIHVTDGAEQRVTLKTITEFELGLRGPVLHRCESFGTCVGVRSVVNASV